MCFCVKPIQYNTCTYYFHNNILSSYMHIINWAVYESYNMTLATLLVSETTHLVLFSIITMKNNATYLFLNEYI